MGGISSSLDVRKKIQNEFDTREKLAENNGMTNMSIFTYIYIQDTYHLGNSTSKGKNFAFVLLIFFSLGACTQFELLFLLASAATESC